MMVRALDCEVVVHELAMDPLEDPEAPTVGPFVEHAERYELHAPTLQASTGT